MVHFNNKNQFRDFLKETKLMIPSLASKLGVSLETIESWRTELAIPDTYNDAIEKLIERAPRTLESEDLPWNQPEYEDSVDSQIKAALQTGTIGEIMCYLEEVLDVMAEEHELQWGDILNLVHGHLQAHRPDAQEEYTDGGHPVFYYGPKED